MNVVLFGLAGMSEEATYCFRSEVLIEGFPQRVKLGSCDRMILEVRIP
jgi:hypothetical protein